MADGFLKRADGKSARILLTNDDGINAPGLVALEKIAAELSDDVLVVAPESEQSGASRSITLSKPLRMRQLGDHKFMVKEFGFAPKATTCGHGNDSNSAGWEV